MRPDPFLRVEQKGIALPFSRLMRSARPARRLCGVMRQMVKVEAASLALQMGAPRHEGLVKAREGGPG